MSGYDQPAWYVARTQPRHEKRVAEQLCGRGVDHFLPLYETTSRWKDRRAKVHLPLFPGYVFVHVAYQDRMQALQLPSIIELVSFGGKPSPVDSQEIEILRRGLNSAGFARPYPYLKAGQRVRVVAGPFEGLTGVIRRTQGSSRLVISIDHIQRSIVVHLDGAEVAPLSNSPFNC